MIMSEHLRSIIRKTNIEKVEEVKVNGKPTPVNSMVELQEGDEVEISFKGRYGQV